MSGKPVIDARIVRLIRYSADLSLRGGAAAVGTAGAIALVSRDRRGRLYSRYPPYRGRRRSSVLCRPGLIPGHLV
jgi:hypothetical protein